MTIGMVVVACFSAPIDWISGHNDNGNVAGRFLRRQRAGREQGDDCINLECD